MAYRNDTYSGGFNHPVFDSQSTFKRVMDALARPGSISEVTAAATPPAPMGSAAGAIALTLADYDTLVYLSPAMIEAGVQSWLAFHTGALVANDRHEATFAFFEAGASLPALSTFFSGTQEYPDRSTTIIFEIAGLTGGETYVLSGPGVDGYVEISPIGLPPHFESMWAANGVHFPRGTDLILAAGNLILCLPRTTRAKRKGG